MNKFRFVDLFAGIGGFHLSSLKFGGELTAFSEIDKTATDFYCKNHNVSPSSNLGDITKISELPEHDLLTAGVPCQSWSIAGKNLGFDDDRGQLWNDTIYLLNKSRPKAFIFENVKGLVDPRNREAFKYILQRIKDAGYYSTYHVLNSYDYGVLQNRKRVYIVGFKDKNLFEKYSSPTPQPHDKRLWDVLDDLEKNESKTLEMNLFSESDQPIRSMKSHNGFNDYFLFNDIRNGDTTIHSWDLIDTSEREKNICLLLLKNRRKSKYGLLDGNPLSLKHLQRLDPSINKQDIEKLIEKGILKVIEYGYKVLDSANLDDLETNEIAVLSYIDGENLLYLDRLKLAKELKIKKISFTKTIESLISKGVLACVEKRYDFRYTKISSGIEGINRIFLPSSDIFSTLVASGSNDYVATVNISARTVEEYKEKLIKQIYLPKKFRKITKEEACILQGFPRDFILPESKQKWMKLLGNSVSIPTINAILKSIAKTGVFEQ